MGQMTSKHVVWLPSAFSSRLTDLREEDIRIIDDDIAFLLILCLNLYSG